MIGQTSILEKSAKCDAAIATAYLIVKMGSSDVHVAQAAAATDNLVGIAQHITSAQHDEVRVMLEGISNLKLGGTVTRGGPVTSDANAKGVAAVLGQNIIGFALASGVNGDIIPVLLTQGILNSPEGVDGRTFHGLARVTYDFAKHGGAVGAISLGVTLPNKAIIVKGFGNIITAFTSAGGAGTIALGANTTNDLLAAVDADTLTGIFNLIPIDTVTTMVKLTADRVITLTVGTEAITAGKAVFFLQYVISD